MAARPGAVFFAATLVSSPTAAFWGISQALFEGTIHPGGIGGAGKALCHATQTSGHYADLRLQERGTEQRHGVEGAVGRHAQAAFEFRSGTRGGSAGAHAATLIQKFSIIASTILSIAFSASA